MRSSARPKALLLAAIACCALVIAPTSRALAAADAPLVETSADGPLWFLDAMARLFLLGVLINEADRPRVVQADEYGGYDDWDRPRRRRTRDAREGFLFSFGLGGGSQYVSQPGLGHAGSFQGNLRLGYGFSDRFQLFFDSP